MNTIDREEAFRARKVADAMDKLRVTIREAIAEYDDSGDHDHGWNRTPASRARFRFKGTGRATICGTDCIRCNVMLALTGELK